MGIYLLLLSFNSVADLRCVIIDEAQPRGVLLRIKGTARRAVTWHHADVSLHRTQYQNLFHPGHGVSATGNIVFPANDTRPESSHAPDCEPPATSPSASAPAARVTSDGHGERDARVRGGGRRNLPREAPCPRRDARVPHLSDGDRDGDGQVSQLILLHIG